MADRLIDAKVRRMVRDPYTDNLFSMVTTAQKVTPRILMETVMRAQQGGKVERPLGSVLHWSPWERLLFSPTYLTRVPPEYGTPIDLRATIGPAAKKPLTVDLPVIVSGMSFGGALAANAKVALALGASRAGTATNTGEAFLPEEREAASRLIVQYIRGTWPRSSQRDWSVLERADAIEIQVGQGAQAGTPQRTKANRIDARMRDVFGLEPGEDALIESHLEGVTSPAEFRDLVRRLKARFPVPVGYKFGATHWLERELAI
ncbi:MAG: FMN-binding glutamate synthase family protein, partial [Clostridia bacterium]|nr:FMN-binding glutamate synthase family protein [Clostridia bacterium]